MKKAVIAVTLVLLLALILPLTLLIAGFCTPAVYDGTYYGELRYMVGRLKSAEGKKIVLVGNSALAFGVRTDFLEREFPAYQVVNFGLYGAIGTKTMLDLSKANIGEGDLVIVIPEQLGQSLSLYFSAENVWLAADGAFGILGQIAKENRAAMAGGYGGFVSGKFSYLSRGARPMAEGVYTQSAFNDGEGNEQGYMTYDRPFNIMPNGYDANNLIGFEPALAEREFIDYLNDYIAYADGRGATVCYGFAPVNGLAVSDGTTEEQIDGWYDFLSEELNCPILGDPNNYILDYEWFYDNNVHLNTAGMSVYTRLLTEDVKAFLGDSSPTSIALPEKPAVPVAPSADGENGDADCFVYEDGEGGVIVTALTEEGKRKSELTIPAVYAGKPVVAFRADVFAGNTAVTQITVQENVRVLYDRSFQGCTRLQKLILKHASPNALGVGTALLEGADNCCIYVGQSSVELFKTHYSWDVYRNEIKSY